MQKLRNLWANAKNKAAAKAGYALLLIAPVVMATSCKKEATCDYEKDNMDAAKTEETRINNEFNVNADSCIHYWAPQMPATFVNAAYGDLPNIATEPYTEQDSITAMTNRANSALPNVPETDPKYFILKGVSRTGGKALMKWNEYLSAKKATQAAQTAYTDCQNSN